MSETAPDYIHDSRPADLHPALQLYDIRDAVVRCEDNLKFMRDLQGGSMKLIVTSPPYNLGKAVLCSE